MKSPETSQSNNQESVPEEITQRELILSHIMTSEEYARIRHDTPYTFELKEGPKKLYFFGADHINDPSNPMFSEIKAAFVGANPDLVLVEGMQVTGDIEKFQQKILSRSETETIERMGESGFTLRLALEHEIPWYCPEPSAEDFNTHLLQQGFSKDEIFAWEVFHLLPQYMREKQPLDFKRYATQWLESFEHVTQWENFDYSYERAVQIGEAILGQTLDMEHVQNPSKFVDPIPWEGASYKYTTLNRISAVSSRFRDQTIVTTILDKFQTYDRIFIVYGASHAPMQEPALEKAFTLMKTAH